MLFIKKCATKGWFSVWYVWVFTYLSIHTYTRESLNVVFVESVRVNLITTTQLSESWWWWWWWLKYWGKKQKWNARKKTSAIMITWRLVINTGCRRVIRSLLFYQGVNNITFKRINLTFIFNYEGHSPLVRRHFYSLILCELNDLNSLLCMAVHNVVY